MKKLVNGIKVFGFTTLFAMNSLIANAADSTGTGTTNPYVQKTIDILTDVKGWILALVGVLTVVVCVIHGAGYQQSSSAQKTAKLDSIKTTLYMGAGIFVIAWIALYVVSQYSSVK